MNSAGPATVPNFLIHNFFLDIADNNIDYVVIMPLSFLPTYRGSQYMNSLPLLIYLFTSSINSVD
jgi:hypothetical protein